ncbi:restriction endonuclease subunit S [Paraburkholderia mimosarum]|uniref:restriction endonuclease subunit S n=1 Tax=Paraburkholderia mimosarum TaxID=312026 RepID=UPI00040999DB|nr:restriction endonuclease subunit S [Paraburkholderia mimosarum]
MLEFYSLRELLSLVVDNRGRTCPTSDTGLPLIATNCVKNSTLYPVFEKVRYVDSETYANWFRAHPQPGDLIFVLKGSPGQVCLTPDPVNFCIAQDMVALRANSDLIDPSYLFAALRSPQIQDSISNLHVGSMIAHFKKGDFDRLKIPVPNRAVQQEIGKVYLRISEKIEHNNNTAATLEEMMRALYCSWFVDFDPVRARAEGLPPAHMDAGTVALFPDGFGEDGLPVGWQRRPLIAQAEWVNGAAYKNMHFSADVDALPIVKIAELKAGITRGTRFTTTDLGARYRIDRGELLYSWSGNPDTSIDAFVWWLGPAWLNQHIFAVRENGSMSLAMLFTMLKHFNPALAEIARNKQTTGLGHITRKDMETFLVTIPTPKVLEAFERILGPLYRRYCETLYETESLATLRDTLLPRLMSGELRVGAARDMVEEVV